MDSQYWLRTQQLLQGPDPIVRRPLLTDALLQRPPFRFLQDVIAEVIIYDIALHAPTRGTPSYSIQLLRSREQLVSALAYLPNCLRPRTPRW